MQKYFDFHHLIAQPRLLLSSTTAVLLLAASAVRADITFYYEGDIIEVDAPLAGNFKVGHKFRGSMTFDETTYDPLGADSGLPDFDDAINAVTFVTFNYQAQASNGDIDPEFQDYTFLYFYGESLSGDSVGAYSPFGAYFGWHPDINLKPEGAVFDGNYPLPVPLFNPNPEYPMFTYERNDVYDASGTKVFNENFQILVDDLDFNQPFFYSDGSLVPYHGYYYLSFFNGESYSTVTGDLTSVTLIPLCNGQEATIYVNARGMIVGGPQNGQVYSGVLNGTGGNDVMRGTESEDEIRGRGGNDLICGLNGDDVLLGGDGDDTLFGGADDDLIKGQNGNDQLFGNAGDDVLHGGRDSDSLNGGTHYDRCYRGESVVRCELTQ